MLGFPHLSAGLGGRVGQFPYSPETTVGGYPGCHSEAAALADTPSPGSIQEISWGPGLGATGLVQARLPGLEIGATSFRDFSASGSAEALKSGLAVMVQCGCTPS